MIPPMVKCRAMVTLRCQDGVPALMATGDIDYRMEDDGTWDGRTVVCNSCYVSLMPLTPSGQALLAELPLAIALARDIAKPVAERARRFTDEAIEAGLTPTAVERPDGSFECTVLARDGSVIRQVILTEGEPPRRVDV